jgi:hypothetical protein
MGTRIISKYYRSDFSLIVAADMEPHGDKPIAFMLASEFDIFLYTLLAEKATITGMQLNPLAYL